MKKKNFLTNALILSVGSVLAKVFSAIYRIGLTRILGGVGIGIYQLVFPVYSLCVVLATAGLPMAISKVVAKHKNNEKNILKKCLIFTSVVSLVLTFLLCVFSKKFAVLQGNEDISICYLILAPTIIILSVASVLRGYFQGKGDFVPSAVSNIFEQFIKLVVGLILCLALLNVGLMASIIGAMVSIILSEIVSLVIMLLYFKKTKLISSNENDVSLKDIVKDVIPITLTNLILPISSFVDSLIVVNLLSLNFSSKSSIFLYGIESGAVSSLVSLPTIFSFAVASVILPNLTEAMSQFNKSKKLSLAIRVILIISVPCVLGFVLVPKRLIGVLYGDRLNDFAVSGNLIASRLLAISGLGVVFLATNQIFSSCLQAINERYVTIRNLVIGVVAKFVIQIIFMPSLILNIYALAIANTTCYILVMTLNYFEIRERFVLRINYLFSGKLILCNSLMLLTLVGVLASGDSAMTTILGIVVAVIVYLGSLLLTNIFNRHDKAFIKYKM